MNFCGIDGIAFSEALNFDRQIIGLILDQNRCNNCLPQVIEDAVNFWHKFMQSTSTRETHLRICVANITPCSPHETLKWPDSTKLRPSVDPELGRGHELHRIGPSVASKIRRLTAEMNPR